MPNTIDSNSGNRTAALNTLISQIATMTAPAGTVVDGGGYSSSTTSFPFAGGLNGTGASTGTGPKAYLNWLVFDRNYTFITGGYQRMTTAARETGQDVAHEKLMGTLNITQPGYVYIYLSNEEGASAYEVYFDQFSVCHTKSPVIQTDDYYPFGLAFNSYKRENNISNRFLFNESESIEDLGLGFYQTTHRMYAPDLGRFWGVDALADLFPSISPMLYSYNNPIKFNDPLGLAADDPVNQGTLDEVTVYANRPYSHNAEIFATFLNSISPIERSLYQKYKKEGAEAATDYWFSNRSIHFGNRPEKSQWAKNFERVAGAGAMGVGGMMLVAYATPVLVSSFLEGSSLTSLGILGGKWSAINGAIEGTNQVVASYLTEGNLSNVDLADIAIAFTPLGTTGANILGSGFDLKPASDIPISMVGYNKSLGAAAIDFTFGFTTAKGSSFATGRGFEIYSYAFSGGKAPAPLTNFKMSSGPKAAMELTIGLYSKGIQNISEKD